MPSANLIRIKRAVIYSLLFLKKLIRFDLIVRTMATALYRQRWSKKLQNLAYDFSLNV